MSRARLISCRIYFFSSACQKRVRAMSTSGIPSVAQTSVCEHARGTRRLKSVPLEAVVGLLTLFAFLEIGLKIVETKADPLT